MDTDTLAFELMALAPELDGPTATDISQLIDRLPSTVQKEDAVAENDAPRKATMALVMQLIQAAQEYQGAQSNDLYDLA